MATARRSGAMAYCPGNRFLLIGMNRPTSGYPASTFSLHSQAHRTPFTRRVNPSMNEGGAGPQGKDGTWTRRMGCGM